MTIDSLKEKARLRIETDNPDKKEFRAAKVYENFMNGVLVSVSFRDATGKEDFNHVHFGQDDVRVYRWHGDVMTAVANHKERSWFFRFLEVSGMGGLIALFLLLVFSVLLSVLAFSGTQVNSSIVDIIKLSFTTILGFFFGSQSGGVRKSPSNLA